MATAKKGAARKPSPKPATTTAASHADQVDEQLARYRSMRDFNITAEPSGGDRTHGSAGLPFCIQKHAATHLHYDFRLGWNGVLKSWACAKGPSYVVGDRHLAVQVEDHPIEYGGFEGIIPKGQYGGGTVMLWDQGTWEPQPGHTDVDAGLRDGNLKFILHGTKMHGKWALIRMGGKAARESKPNWLLIKEHDSFERTASDPAVTEAETTSVVTARTMEQIAASEDHVWNSKDTARGNAWFRQESKAPGTAGLEHLPREHQPSFLKPQLAQEAETPPDGSGWIHELKLDGYRMQARKDGAKVQMLTRTGLDWTERVKSVAAEVARLPAQNITLDGEVVVVAADGTTNFADLQASFQEGARNPLTYFCFDLLHLDGHNPRALPLLERKELLTETLRTADPTLVRVSEHLQTDGLAMFHKACELHAEGIVSKKANAPYREGRSGDWLKSKCLHEQEFVVAGFTLPNKGGPGIGALLLAYYDDAGKLIYAGRAGTGFTQKLSAQLRRQLEPMRTEKPKILKAAAEDRRGALWVRPELVAQVRFSTWTAEDQLRHAAFLGLREDKVPTEVRREAADAAPKPKQHGRKAAAAAPPPAKPVRKPPSRPIAAPPMQKAPVRLTHPNKVLDAESALTKQQLADYYWAVAERMLPYIADRPLSLVRCPDGSEKPCFYQKHVNNMLPKSVNTVMVADKKSGVPEPYITLHTREALAGLAQMGVLEIHPWGSQNGDLEHPDQLTIDLDPDESLPWEILSGAALEVRKRLAELGLESWVKTTGGKGLHVVIPIEPELGWPEIKQWCHGFVDLMARSNPRLYLTVMTKAARTGRIYLDYLRNERGATAVAPYSPRARRGMGVAVPLSWPELHASERPQFRASTYPAWGGRLKKDVWAGYLACKQRISPEAQKAAGLKR